MRTIGDANDSDRILIWIRVIGDDAGLDEWQFERIGISYR